LNFEVRRKGSDGAVEEGLIATAHFVLVSVRRDTLDPIPVPDELRRAFADYTSS
jgi:acyl-CoA thioesterase FadM